MYGQIIGLDLGIDQFLGAVMEGRRAKVIAYDEGGRA